MINNTFKKFNRNTLLFLLFSLSPLLLFAQPYGKKIISLNDKWSFELDGQATAQVNLPHTWNFADTKDEHIGYFRGIGTYTKDISLPAPLAAKEKAYLYIGAANSVANVTINGKPVLEHFGGYSSFEVEITEALKDKNTCKVIIVVNNKKDTTVPPLSADFNSYGGLYRGCSLVIRGANSFQHPYTSSGYEISYPSVTPELSKALIKLRLQEPAIKNTTFTYELTDWTGKLVKKDSWPVIDKTIAFSIEQAFKIWTPANPKWYTIKMRLLSNNNELLDSTGGFITFKQYNFHPDYGFFLNGNPLKLLGTNRHQDYPNQGWATHDSVAVKDIRLIKEMGANFVRLAHYPQSAAVLNTCDTLGLLVWEEIPLVDYTKSSTMLTRNSTSALREMIYQHAHHPSVIVWGLMNEIFIQMTDKEKFGGNDAWQKQLNYTADLARILHEEAKSLDPKRYTAIACHQDPTLYINSGLFKYPDILSWNMYKGWYGGSTGDFLPFMQELRIKFPDKILGISEFGAGSDERISSAYPEKFDFSPEYQEFFLNQYLRTIKSTRWLAFGLQWNMIDFQSEFRGDVQPHINNKGLLTETRTKKIGWHLFKAHTATRNYIKVAASAYPIRVHWVPNQEEFVFDTLSVYSNSPYLSVKINSNDQIITPQIAPVYRIPYKAYFGRNIVIAKSGSYADTATIRHSIAQANMTDFTKNRREICLNFGAKFQFYDPTKKQIWWPTEADDCLKYSGISHNGKAKRFKTWFGDKPMSEPEIALTTLEPLYQSRIDSVTKLYLPLPEGTYSITAHYSLLPEDLEKSDNILYLREMGSIITLSKTTVTKQMANQALQSTFNIFVKDKGITFQCVSSSGNFILNGLSINKK